MNTSSATDAYHLIATVPKNSREELRVALSEFKGHPFVDVRVFADMGHEDRSPTKAGVTIKLGSIRAMINALEAAHAAAVQRGQLDA